MQEEGLLTWKVAISVASTYKTYQGLPAPPPPAAAPVPAAPPGGGAPGALAAALFSAGSRALAEFVWLMGRAPGGGTIAMSAYQPTAGEVAGTIRGAIE